eukprot:Hpha_TRINITY_DN15389_c2_g3::TRINITY_DN15389_c2_g3_i13::g.87589::m.87589/K11839/USP8, UBP5; ubiquitin carboxyl-terminal hydrolase 8
MLNELLRTEEAQRARLSGDEKADRTEIDVFAESERMAMDSPSPSPRGWQPPPLPPVGGNAGIGYSMQNLFAAETKSVVEPEPSAPPPAFFDPQTSPVHLPPAPAPAVVPSKPPSVDELLEARLAALGSKSQVIATEQKLAQQLQDATAQARLQAQQPLPQPPQPQPQPHPTQPQFLPKPLQQPMPPTPQPPVPTPQQPKPSAPAPNDLAAQQKLLEQQLQMEQQRLHGAQQQQLADKEKMKRRQTQLLDAKQAELEKQLAQMQRELAISQQQHQPKPKGQVLLPAEQELLALKKQLQTIKDRPPPPPSRPPAAYRWSFPAAPYGIQRQPRRGIVNLGNTCYMNSVLQALHATPLVTDVHQQRYQVNPNNPLGFQGRIADAYRYVVGQFHLARLQFSISPSKFKEVISQRNPTFEGFSQQDASEFLRTLLGGLHDDLNVAVQFKTRPVPQIVDHPSKTDDELAGEARACYATNNSSLVDDHFAFVERSSLHCPQCRHTARNFIVTQSLELPIPRGDVVSLDQCLTKYTEPERLDEDAKWTCSGCGKKVRAEKRLSLHDAPRVLVLMLKRFRSFGDLTDKVTSGVVFPPVVDLSPYVASSGPAKYDVVGIVNHEGGLGGGHYTCDAKGRDDGQWCFFSDERFHQSTGEPKWRQAYVLFLVRRDKP